MGTKCDLCDREATVHEVIVKNGVPHERHLCEFHAAQLGIITSSSTDSGSVESESKSPGASKSDEGHMKQRPVQELKCQSCGTSFSKFRKIGLLGCPDCYTTFQDRLSPLLKRAHEGADHHTGKVPDRAGTSEQKRAQLLQLRKQLADALDVEAYERAADIRDQIAKLEQGPRALDDASARATRSAHEGEEHDSFMD